MLFSVIFLLGITGIQGRDSSVAQLGMGQMADFSGLTTKNLNDLENHLITQSYYYQIMGHILLKLYIQVNFEKVAFIISD